jgi:hypothetical protein
MTDYEINAFWLLRGEIRGGDLLAQLRDFAREVERAARAAAIEECRELMREHGWYEQSDAIRALLEGS